MDIHAIGRKNSKVTWGNKNRTFWQIFLFYLGMERASAHSHTSHIYGKVSALTPDKLSFPF